jgi:hypothetical protein
VAVSHLETDLNTPGERTVALLAGLFRMEPHELVAATSYPAAKADRLPLVVARWTEVEHQLALLARDLWWLDRGTAPTAGAAEAVLDEWEATWLQAGRPCSTRPRSTLWLPLVGGSPTAKQAQVTTILISPVPDNVHSPMSVCGRWNRCSKVSPGRTVKGPPWRSACRRCGRPACRPRAAAPRTA